MEKLERSYKMRLELVEMEKEQQRLELEELRRKVSNQLNLVEGLQDNIQRSTRHLQFASEVNNRDFGEDVLDKSGQYEGDYFEEIKKLKFAVGNKLQNVNQTVEELHKDLSYNNPKGYQH